MSHVFKEVTGHTIMTYLMQYRLSKARNQLIQEPDERIKIISQESGFESEAHFSRFFKRNMGVSPSEYRKQQYNIINEGEL
ncbi:MAG TPA: helix-turn-helix domain-containing protein [Candidatus Jeotgalibaca pullicola]|nr:helix-turn-helix domain-containing protein [Candidatus Jeotgalibaca pullicola]